MHLSLILPSNVLPLDPREPESERRMRAIVRRFERPLLAFAVRFTGEPERARDVVQDTFARFARSGPDEFEGGDPARWLFTVCRHRALDVCRREGRVTFVDQDELANAPSSAPAPDEAAARGDEQALLLRIVAQLPARLQELLQLKFQQNLSYREIAAVTGLSETNVGFLLHTALKKLRALREEAERPRPLPPSP